MLWKIWWSERLWPHYLARRQLAQQSLSMLGRYRGGGDREASKRGVIGEGKHAPQCLAQARRVSTVHCVPRLSDISRSHHQVRADRITCAAPRGKRGLTVPGPISVQLASGSATCCKKASRTLRA